MASTKCLYFSPSRVPRCCLCCDLSEKYCVSWKRNSFSDMLIFSWKLDQWRKMSQISIWPSLCCMYIAAHNLQDMHDAALIMTIDRLMFQGYKVLRLEKLFKNFYDIYPDLIEKYQRSVMEIVNDSFSWYNLLYIQQDFSRVSIIFHGFVNTLFHWQLWLVSCLWQTTLTQSQTPGRVIGLTKFSH